MTNTLTVSELEARMRPGAWSDKGFLGPTEFLEDVIDQDAQTLASRGISHEQIADVLERVVQAAFEQESSMSFEEIRQRGLQRECPDLDHPENIPNFTIDNLPESNKGFLVGDLQVFIAGYLGIQECPWECAVQPNWGSFDFLILNRRTGEYITGPGLIVHLIRAHHFFEGVETSYRTDPSRVIRVLEISPEPAATSLD